MRKIIILALTLMLAAQMVTPIAAEEYTEKFVYGRGIKKAKSQFSSKK